ncbi:MAG TPA: cytochrome c oxidase accessory protein CcoG [Chitinophagaceae bacterium]
MRKHPHDTAPESFRDQLATLDEKGKRRWIFAQKPKGKYYNARSILSFFFFALFFALPFIKVDGRPLFLFNITEAKFHLFGKVFWPQDFFIFGLIMITSIFFVILFTAAFGRLFCGWACPHTIFLEMLFRRIEYWFLGNPNQQRVLKTAPWSTMKLLRVGGKHLTFYLIAFVIANFFLAYIIGMDELKKIITEPVTGHLVGFTTLLAFSGVFYGVFAFFREQACTAVCPYGRLQSVLLDKNSMIVAYDYMRGEPRGNFKKLADANLGDCVDCYQCVEVCPTGIDIRNGVQMECVGCTACIDACDMVMERLNKPKGLIRYASENSIQKGERLHFTTRMKVYTGLCLLLLTLLTVLLATRRDIGATVMRTPGILFQERGADSVSNLYNIKMVNKTIKPIPLTIKVEQGKGNVEIVGGRYIAVQEEGQGSGSFFVVLPRNMIKKRKTSIQLGLYEGENKIAVVQTSFLAPVAN